MDKQDLLNYRAMKAVLNNGKFEIKGDAILKVASLIIWYNSLEDKIKLAADKPLEKAIITHNEEK